MTISQATRLGESSVTSPFSALQDCLNWALDWRNASVLKNGFVHFFVMMLSCNLTMYEMVSVSVSHKIIMVLPL